ncbi:8227_t:CDS:2 [Entrophospora sp. SA101]|nr:8227_t:CDS:2 [Entrophospora sp. SA101]
MKPNLFFFILIVISYIIKVSGDKELNKNLLCKNKKLTNGQQIRQGSCSQTIQGEIPSVNKMPSTLIIEPINGQILKSQQSFRVKTKTSNLITGFFTDPNEKYYTEPQQLKNGVIKGHSHITIQKLDGNNLPDAKDFAFFKGLDQPDKNGILSVKVKGLSPGDYRICTLVSSFSHQPVIMPVAKRGSQDDFIALIPGLDEQQIGPGIHLAAWSLMFLAMAAISILYNNYKKIDSRVN